MPNTDYEKVLIQGAFQNGRQNPIKWHVKGLNISYFNSKNGPICQYIFMEDVLEDICAEYRL